MPESQTSLPKQIDRILTSRAKRRLLVLLAMIIFSAFLELSVVSMVLPLMAGILEPDTLFSRPWIHVLYQMFFFRSQSSYLTAVALALGILYIFKGACIFLTNKLLFRFTASTQEDIGRQLFRRFVSADYSYLAKTNTSHITSSLTTATTNTMILLNSLMLFASECVIAASLFGFMVVLDYQVALLGGGAVAMVLLITSRILSAKSLRAGQISSKYNALQLRAVNQAFGGVKEIKVNKREKLFYDQYCEAMTQYIRSLSRGMFYSSLPRVVIENMSMAMVFVVLGILSITLGDLSSKLPSFAAFGFAAVRLLPAANRLLTNWNNIAYYRPFLSLVYDELNREDAPSDISEKDWFKTGSSQPVKPLTDGIYLENVTFGFSDSNARLFENVNLKIPANRSVAFIGATGAGKTTLADIILGLREVQAGVIKADGRDIRENDGWWSAMVGYIPQSVYLCDDTIRANVAFGIPEEKIDEKAIWQALRDAQMSEFVAGLPQGLDTLVGENGVRLSGGQRQRIGIARALYQGPQFLIMDEGTSSLDDETEQAVIESINGLSGKITMLIIAHRMSTIQYCDYIYLVEDGKVTLND